MGKGLKQRVEVLERRLIVAALKKTDGVQARAAKVLGISERVLRYKIRKYSLEAPTKLSNRDRIVEHSIPFRKTDG